MTFDEVIEKISDGYFVKRSDIQSRALTRKVWLAEWHIPGCMSESQMFATTKHEAIQCAMSMAETENGIPRGMRTALRRNGRFDCQTEMFGAVINTVSRMSLSDLI